MTDLLIVIDIYSSRGGSDLRFGFCMFKIVIWRSIYIHQSNIGK